MTRGDVGSAGHLAQIVDRVRPAGASRRENAQIGDGVYLRACAREAEDEEQRYQGSDAAFHTALQNPRRRTDQLVGHEGPGRYIDEATAAHGLLQRTG